MINNVLLDEKGRIYIPKSSMLRESEKILLKRENDLTFSSECRQTPRFFLEVFL